jgi:hypothetical protein
MDRDRSTILALVACGRITASEAERLLAAWNESRETAWILLLCLAFACLAQFHLRDLLPALSHFINAQVPALAEAVHHAFWPINEFLGGLL